MRVVVACGGTGGHAYPGIATARTLRDRGHETTIWLAMRRAESGVAQDWSGNVERLPLLPFGPPWRAAGWRGFASQVRGVVRCRRLLRASRPDVLLAMGSYTSVAPVLAARSLHIPVVLHEANAVPGRAIVALARLAHRVAVTFDSAGASFPPGKTERTGLPLRNLERSRMTTPAFATDRKTLLVMGGSQGAHAVNEAATEALTALDRNRHNVQVLHLAGEADAPEVERRYREAGVPHVVLGYLQDMGQAYGTADLALCRAGAASCMELAAMGIPAVLVPLPGVSRNHQLHNARYIEEHGGGRVIEQGAGLAQRLQAEVARLLDDQAALHRMSEAMTALAIRDGADRLSRLLEDVGNRDTGS